jgi:ABC-2 type transport system ATP-binding protein
LVEDDELGNELENEPRVPSKLRMPKGKAPVQLEGSRTDLTMGDVKFDPEDKKYAVAAWHLEKNFGDVIALDDVSFYVNKGEVFGLLGSNGAGKTTSLKIFSGLIRPNSGEAYVLGKRVKGNELFVKSKIGYLPETPNLYETMTGYELLDLIATLRRMNETDKEKRIAHLAEVLELEAAMDKQLGTYSKGMRQKMAFATAVIHKPKILLLDEPTAGLDPRFAKLFKTWIREFGKTGTTVVMSTHLTLVAEEICDRIAIISSGKILAVGTVEELKKTYDAQNLEDIFVKVVGGKDWRTFLQSSL